MIFTPIGNYVAVVQVKPRERRVAGGTIIAPDMAISDQAGLVGRVIGFGDDAAAALEGVVAPGTLVFFGRYSGTNIKIEEQEVIMLQPPDILGTLTPAPGEADTADG